MEAQVYCEWRSEAGHLESIGEVVGAHSLRHTKCHALTGSNSGSPPVQRKSDGSTR